MNIESITGSAPQRSVAADTSQQASRQAAVQGKSQVASESANAVATKQQVQTNDEQRKELKREDVDSAVKKIAEFVSPNQADINFSVDESSGIRVVKIIDRNSNEVIRQMPSEEAVALAEALDKLQGLLIRDKA
jgi:flagellar protein FlaG